MSATPDWLDALLEPQPDDSSDLRWALETAVALLHRGDRPQAMRWLEHAIATAHAEGRADRTSHLSRAVAELEQRANPRRVSRPMPAMPQKGTQLMAARPLLGAEVPSDPTPNLAASESPFTPPPPGRPRPPTPIR